MAVDALLPAGIAAVGSVLSNALNVSNQNKQNNESRKFSWQMYAQQRRDAMADWNMQNAYNDPAAQMERLKNAGLNPHLVYGKGADAQSQSAPRGSSAPTPTFNAPRMNLDTTSLALMALQAQQLKANISRTEAETEAIRSRTVGTEFQNELNRAIGIDQMQYKYNTEVNKLSQEQKRDLMDFENIIAVGYGEGSADVNSAISKARAAGYQLAVKEAENAATRGDIYKAEKVIKDFEANLAKQGLSPNSPYYLKLLLSLANKFGLNLD